MNKHADAERCACRLEMDSWQLFGRKGLQQREVTVLSHPGLLKEAVGLLSSISFLANVLEFLVL